AKCCPIPRGDARLFPSHADTIARRKILRRARTSRFSAGGDCQPEAGSSLVAAFKPYWSAYSRTRRCHSIANGNHRCSRRRPSCGAGLRASHRNLSTSVSDVLAIFWSSHPHIRSEEHTSELQSLRHLVCRLLLEKKKIQSQTQWRPHLIH